MTVLSHNSGVLASFWYYKRVDLLGMVPPSVPLIIDSGAYSAWTSGGSVTLREYADWLDVLGDRPKFAINLDVIGDSEASYKQWKQLRKLGHDLVPVIHFGDRPPILERYLDEGATRVAFSGAAVPRIVDKVEKWQAYMFRWMRDNNHMHIPVHGLGVHMRSRLGRLPWATTDSSTFSMAWRFGRMGLWTGNRWVQVDLDGRQMLKHRDLVRRYGFNVRDVAVSEPATRHQLVRFATRNEIEAGMHPRHNPASTTRFMVDGSTEHLQLCARYLANTGHPATDTPPMVAELIKPPRSGT